MRVERFEWNDENASHIIAHDVWPDEVEEIFSFPHHVRKTKDEKYLVYGKTSSGRYLFVIVAKKPQNCIKVISARGMTDKEKKAFRKVLRR